MAKSKRVVVQSPAAEAEAAPAVAAAAGDAEATATAVAAQAPVEAPKTKRVAKTRKKAAPAVDAAAGAPPAAPPEPAAPQPAARAADAWSEGAQDWVEDVETAYLQSKYTLVSVASKRARQLLGGSKRRVDSLSEKPVTVALEELGQGKLYFERTRDGIK